MFHCISEIEKFYRWIILQERLSSSSNISPIIARTWYFKIDVYGDTNSSNTVVIYKNITV